MTLSKNRVRSSRKSSEITSFETAEPEGSHAIRDIAWERWRPNDCNTSVDQHSR
jgi:hypothetical protein